MIEQKWKNLRKATSNQKVSDAIESPRNSSPAAASVRKLSASAMLDSLTDEAKSKAIVQKCFLQQTTHWRTEFEAERLAMVPSVTCRICQQKFYADQAKRHAEFCNKQLNFRKGQNKTNKSFLDINSKLTTMMVSLQKKASQETGSAYSRRNSIVSNSSFQFLNRIGNAADGATTSRRMSYSQVKQSK